MPAAVDKLPPGFKRTPAARPGEETPAGHEMRVFVGEGKPELSVPGLVEVSRVQVSGIEIPARIPVEFPKDGSGELVKIAPPGYILEDEVLFRSLHSNDGIWQAGAQVAITGLWKPEKKA